MESWIRYSVAVYVGLLLAGAAMYTNDVKIGPAASADTGWYYAPQNPEALITPPEHHPAIQDNKQDSEQDKSATSPVEVK